MPFPADVQAEFHSIVELVDLGQDGVEDALQQLQLWFTEALDHAEGLLAVTGDGGGTINAGGHWGTDGWLIQVWGGQLEVGNGLVNVKGALTIEDLQLLEDAVHVALFGLRIAIAELFESLNLFRGQLVLVNALLAEGEVPGLGAGLLGEGLKE